MPQLKYEVSRMHFNRVEFQEPSGDKVVVYSEDTGAVNPFEVKVSKAGFQLRGEMSGHVSSESDFQELARFMSDWCQDARRLRPRIAINRQDADPVV